MNPDLADLNAFFAVARARGFREAARTAGASASTLSDAVRRLETALDVRLMGRLAPALGEVEGLGRWG